MSAGRRDIRGDRVRIFDGRSHLESGVGAANRVVSGCHRVDAQPVRRTIRQHGRQRVVSEVLVPLVGHLSLDLRVVAGQRRGSPVGLRGTQSGPDRAVGARGEAADHPAIAVGRRVGEVVPNHLGAIVGDPRIHGWAPFDVSAVVRFFIDVETGGDDDRRRDDAGGNGLVQFLLDTEALQDSVGSARVTVQELDNIS